MARASGSKRAGASSDPSSRFPDELAEQLLERSRRIKVREGEVVIAEGTRSSEVYYIVSGTLTASVLSFGGWETVFRDMGPGELVGELAAIDGAERSASVIAKVDSEIACLRATKFRTFLSEVPRAGFWLAQQLARRVRNLSDRAFEMASLPVAGRLIAELVRLPGETSGDMRAIPLMPTHAELAARIGTHRETATRELRALARKGLVRQRGRSLELTSIGGLQRLMQELRR